MPQLRRAAARRLAPLGVADYRRIWSAGIVSGLGDWAGTLAIALMVEAATGSAMLTAAVLTARVAAWLGPGQLLTAHLERIPRRTVLLVCDISRVALYLLAATGALPVWGLLALSVVDGLIAVPFKSARAAVTPEATGEELYGRAVALSNMTFQAEVLLGSAMGGVLSAVMGPQASLVVDAGTFAVSAAIFWRLQAGRQAVRPATAGGRAGRQMLVRTVRQMAALPVVRTSALIAVTYGTTSVIQALSVPYAAQVVAGAAGRSPAGVAGLLASAVGAGALAGAICAPAEGTDRRLLRAGVVQLAGGYGLAAAAVMASTLLLSGSAGMWASAAGFFAAGVSLGASVPVGAVFGVALPHEFRGTGFSVAMGSLRAWQGALALIGGAIAESVGSAVAVAFCCGCSLVVAGIAAVWGGAVRGVSETAGVPG